MLSAASFTKQCDKCSFVFTLYESVSQTMINVINPHALKKKKKKKKKKL